MKRRIFLQTAAAASMSTVGLGATSPATGSVEQSPPADTAATIRRGRHVRQQAQYDDGTAPETLPEYETLTESIDHHTKKQVVAGRALFESLHQRLAGTDHIDFETLSISIRPTTDGIALFVGCPTAAAVDQWEQAAESVREQLRAEIDNETLQDRVGELQIELRERPRALVEHGCEETVGRFADAQYRANGIAMGAAVRSDTLGQVASSGFRGLREGRAMVVTTAHTFETSDSQDQRELRGAKLYQSRHPHTVGRCHAVGRDHGPGVDAAAVAVEADQYPSRFLADPGGDSYHDEPIVGTASWELLETHLVEDRPIYKQGAVTGRCEGRLVELREFSNGYRELDVDIHSDGGDSGGPYFVQGDEGLLVAGIHKGVRTDTNERRAIFVDSVCDSLGIEVY